MGLKDAVKNDMISAMKDNDTVKRDTLRSVLGAITEAETVGKERKVLTDSDVIALLKKLVKMRRDSAQIYKDANAMDRAEREIDEATIIDSYIPAQLSEDKIRSLVADIIDKKDLKDQGPRGIGQVMKEIKGRDDVDSSLASKIAKEMLN